MNIYDLSVKDANGKNISLKEYKGKALLIVNTATGCGFTPQYKGLQELYDQYKDRGFEILDFPCNQFLGQAPGEDQEIVDFCQLKYGVSFKTFSKINVNGSKAEPLFSLLKKNSRGLMGSSIKWNFTKFLVSKDGQIAGRFAPNVEPGKLQKEIEALL
ncbi:glutathione peroxidase [Desulfosporosinus fructosivorans]|uniref:Glutathione peroxidase n=1 Tax=Desulfosporosinus fructosivorans TaxID=2018669 RepID=A0A4Z0QY20_9FIRM|nr:glutathione peroxidase [Desulfosporosinus fructosivorans]TGE35408.1 glutathione peroxidase [Desulfosporosinus fructosivorans]